MLKIQQNWRNTKIRITTKKAKQCEISLIKNKNSENANNNTTY